MAVEMRQSKSRYRAERQFKRAVSSVRFNGRLFLIAAIACAIFGITSAAAGNVKNFVGFGLMAAIFGAGAALMLRVKRRPHWLKIAVLREQQERNRDHDDR
ncbi:MAG TPA: hypothetical protein VG826_05950 [Pirellulales bacterium]|nr:hypothetical protein [Pirellulales bacterium]